MRLDIASHRRTAAEMDGEVKPSSTSTIAIALRSGIYAALAFWVITFCLLLPFEEAMSGPNPSMVQVITSFFGTFLLGMPTAVPKGIVCGVLVGTVVAIVRV